MALAPALQWLWEPLVAAGLGLLIGLEREHARGANPAGAPPATPPPATPPPATSSPGDDLHRKGARTFALIALFGYGAAVGGERFAALPLVALLSIAALLAVLHLRRAQPGEPRGEDITTEIAALSCWLLGLLTRVHQQLAVLLGLLITVILFSKPWLRGLVPRVRRVEFTGTLQLLVAVLIIYPMVPDVALPLPGPLAGALNPRSLVLFVTLTAGVGYVGYFMIRILGPQRGLGVTGLLGGLTSSTAVTMAMGEHAKAAPALCQPAALATLLACGVMIARVVVLSAVVSMPLALRLLLPCAAMLLGYGVAGLLLRWQARRGQRERAPSADHPVLVLDNPFELGSALKFGLVYALVLLLSRGLHSYLGSRGLYLASVVAGLADVDSITLAAARLAREGTAQSVAATSVLIAVASNTVAKTVLAWTAGGGPFARRVALGHGVAVLLGGAGLLWSWLR